MTAPTDATSSRRLGPLARLAATTLLFWPAFGLYFVIAHGQPEHAAKVTMPSWVPFRPEFALPYLGLLLVGWLLPVAVRDAGRFVACLRAMTYAFLPVALCWLLVPTEIARPTRPDGLWARPYLWIAALDPPRCVLPCAHGIGPTAAAWFVGRDRPSWRLPLASMLLLGLPSIALVGQHRPVDILLGEAAAAFGIAVAEVADRRARGRRAEGRRPR